MKTKLKRSQSSRSLTLFLLYELGHVDGLERLFRNRPHEYADSLAIALSFDIEEELRKRNIPFSSGRDYKKIAPDLLTAQDAMMDAFFVDPRWKIFTYRSIELRTTFLFMFRAYFQRVWYYGNLLISILEAHPEAERLAVFAPSGMLSSVAGGLSHREREVVIDCTKIVAARSGMSVTIVPSDRVSEALHDRFRLFFFTVRRIMFGLFLAVWNASIAFLCRPRRPRLLISDHWRNVGSAIELLKEGECIFLDRLEMRRISWRMLLRYRMRFVHSEDFVSRRMRKRAQESAQEFAREWDTLRSDIDPVFMFRGYSFDALLVQAVDDIVRGFGKLLREIEGTYALYEHFKPDVVLLRASVSGQTHFSILPLVARETHIPSLELQHGLEYLGPGSWSREHAAEHIASYGPLVKEELVSAGHAPEHVHEIGSPRFDAFSRIPTVEGNGGRPLMVLCISPDIRVFEIYDSYSAEDYFTTVAAAIEALGDVRTIIKFRPGSSDEDPLRLIAAKAFSRVPYVAASSEPLSGLFDQADIVVSCYSTVVLEALQRGIPVVIPSLNFVDAAVVRFHFSRYVDAGVLRIASTQEELAASLAELEANPALRSDMGKRARVFIDRNFSFDGHSSSRCAALIIELADRSMSSVPE